MNRIKIKYFSDIPKIEKIAQGDWIDLRAAADVTLKKDEMSIIPLAFGSLDFVVGQVIGKFWMSLIAGAMILAWRRRGTLSAGMRTA